MFRLKIAAIIGGAMLAFFGIQEYRVSSGTTAEPIEVDLAEVEAGQQIDNSHWRLGPHLALYGGCVYECKVSKHATGEPGPDARCNYCYYPVISYQHDYIQKLAALQEQYGSLDAAPDNEFPTLNDIKVIVKTKQFKTLGDIPEGMSEADALQGLVINRITSLDDEEVELFHDGFPGMNVDELVLLEADRNPSSLALSGLMILGGAVLALAGLAWMVRGSEEKADSTVESS